MATQVHTLREAHHTFRKAWRSVWRYYCLPGVFPTAFDSISAIETTLFYGIHGKACSLGFFWASFMASRNSLRPASPSLGLGGFNVINRPLRQFLFKYIIHIAPWYQKWPHGSGDGLKKKGGRSCPDPVRSLRTADVGQSENAARCHGRSIRGSCGAAMALLAKVSTGPGYA